MTPSPTHWRQVALLIAAGVIAACQVGKAAIAVPLLRQDLDLSLAAASWVLGAYGMLGALAGLAAGIAVSMIDPKRALAAGLAAIAVGSLTGAMADTGALLIATRVIEGCGFLAVVIAVPTLLRGVTAPSDRDVAFTLWAAYMPAGSALMMVAGPLLAGFGWQNLWLVNAALAAVQAAIVWFFIPPSPSAERADLAAIPKRVAEVIRLPGPALLAIAFGTYTFHYFALTGLMPTLLVERMGLSVSQAGAITAATVVANALGNVSAGALLRMGIPLWAIMATGFSFAGAASLGIFSDALPIALIALLAALSLAVTGMVPASIFAASPRLARSAPALGITLGLIIQGSNIGQLLGPVVLGGFAERFGWSAAPALIVAVAAAEVAIALRLRVLLRDLPRA